MGNFFLFLSYTCSILHQYSLFRIGHRPQNVLSKRNSVTFKMSCSGTEQRNVMLERSNVKPTRCWRGWGPRWNVKSEKSPKLVSRSSQVSLQVIPTLDYVRAQPYWRSLLPAAGMHERRGSGLRKRRNARNRLMRATKQGTTGKSLSPPPLSLIKWLFVLSNSRGLEMADTLCKLNLLWI